MKNENEMIHELKIHLLNIHVSSNKWLLSNCIIRNMSKIVHAAKVRDLCFHIHTCFSNIILFTFKKAMATLFLNKAIRLAERKLQKIICNTFIYMPSLVIIIGYIFQQLMGWILTFCRVSGFYFYYFIPLKKYDKAMFFIRVGRL